MFSFLTLKEEVIRPEFPDRPDSLSAFGGEWMIGWLAAGMNNDDFPELTIDYIRACLSYAADRDCKHVSDVGLNDAEDHVIWQFTKENNFSIVTFDSDYFDISLIKGHPPKIIWIRTGNLTTVEIIDLMIKYFDSISSFLTDPNQKEMACKELEY